MPYVILYFLLQQSPSFPVALLQRHKNLHSFESCYAGMGMLTELLREEGLFVCTGGA